MSYRKLEVWKKSHEVAKKVYRVTESFPNDEKYGIRSQIRRAATSIPINIAEGKGTTFKAKFINFLDIARGSAYELDYLLLFTNEVGYINNIEFKELQNENQEIIKMLNSLMSKVKSK